jgi:hypothetical protein
MRRKLLVVLLAVASGCGGDAPDYAPNFAGLWTGTLTATDPATGTVLGSDSVEVNLIETSRSILKFNNACFGNGPFLQATSTAFNILAAYTCGPETSAQCGSVVVTYNSISGGRSGTSLTFTAQVTGALCNQNVPETWAFTGTKSGPPTEGPPASLRPQEAPVNSALTSRSSRALMPNR